MNIVSTAKDIFLELNNSKIPYCIWKNLHLLNETSKNKSKSVEYDIYIPYAYQKQIKKLFFKYKGIELNPQIHFFPKICHYYFLDKNGNFLHLHIYFEIYTGDSFCKDYHLPFGEKILKNRVIIKKCFYITSKKYENLLTTLRIYLKTSSLLGLIFYLRDRDDYQKQIHNIKVNSNLPSIEENIIPINKLTLFMNSLNSSSLFKKYKIGKTISRYFRKYKRINKFQSLLLQIKAILFGLQNRMFKPKKKLLNKGYLIAIVGSDGAGKSTISSLLCEKLSQEIEVREIHFGTPPSTIYTFPLRIIISIYRLKTFLLKRNSSLVNKKIKKYNFLTAMRYVILAFERKVLLDNALKDTKKGVIVICNRIYSQNFGVMDSPRLNPKYAKNRIQRFLSKIESNFYARMPIPELLIKLNVPLKDLQFRNRKRIKKRKESDFEIKKRYEQYKELKYKCNRIFNIQSISSKEETLKIILPKVWEEIAIFNNL